MIFYICSVCGSLTTSKKMEEGYTDCFCEYAKKQSCTCGDSKKVFNKVTERFETIVYRKINQYSEIPTWLYIQLKKEKNTVLRLEQYNSWLNNKGD